MGQWIYMIIDYLITHENSFFGDAQINRNISDELKQVIIGVSLTYQIINSPVVLLPNFLLMSLAYSIWCLFSHYHDHVRNVITTDQPRFIANIGRYRHSHLELCELIETMDKTIGLLLAVTIIAFITMLLLSLYMMALALGPETSVHIGFYLACGFYIMGCTSVVVGLTYFVHKVFVQVRVLTTHRSQKSGIV